ncbi:methylated-DNA--[protein]-cysteine S-methyltransferase [Mycolicibacter kumamotonensis]|jgi:methylated-DNA-[protein]-cysteine S-methyltransferase|uniref:Methylated-DNA--protein-cysteine methyltransferase n=1 Tax=Mycolicibacter kumamotonensis TaxID=354243 RepID=A0A1B8SCJ6_9MYCO|nr:methylated-DNA--[protein]-cysteine S-methyltransferase [Mycolicibacter kumamotonensis]NDJ91543.1 methylated-DNA--[protein]-cysteine S-methyltransferase [Mycolicibacter kumamotonensis]OBY30450.1 cysteine methyltransferase [Mycolicibacter kumamotonensis]ORA76119.1 cysteine methyltransferase [Mycolicibacter kumamotonensis]
MTCQRIIDSPIGPLTLAGKDGKLSHLLMLDHSHAPDQTGWRRDDTAFPDVVEQLAAYFAGDLTEFDLTYHMAGTEFQRRVWTALLTIPYGQTRSYGQLAMQIGAPTASRAVGLANGRNPISIIVPCHRVIGSNGSLTGYGGGIDRKRALLDLERQHSHATLFD